MKTSIVMNAFDNNVIQRQITIAALGNIQKYTDDYELILIDNGKLKNVEQKYNCINLAQHIENEQDIGFSASMNLGVEKSNPEYPFICFIHNDVFVWEGWLKNLLKHLSEFDVIVPSQGYITREQVKASYEGKINRLDNDAGLMVMAKETFRKSGGWREEFKSVFQEKAYRDRLKEKGLILYQTPDVIITHLGWTTLGFDDNEFEKNRTREGELLNE